MATPFSPDCDDDWPLHVCTNHVMLRCWLVEAQSLLLHYATQIVMTTVADPRKLTSCDTLAVAPQS